MGYRIVAIFVPIPEGPAPRSQTVALAGHMALALVDSSGRMIAQMNGMNTRSGAASVGDIQNGVFGRLKGFNSEVVGQEFGFTAVWGAEPVAGASSASGNFRDFSLQGAIARGQATVLFGGDDADVLARWGMAASASEQINALGGGTGVPYFAGGGLGLGAFGFANSGNSNSYFRTLVLAMGLDNGGIRNLPWRGLGGVEAVAPGLNRILLGEEAILSIWQQGQDARGLQPSASARSLLRRVGVSEWLSRPEAPRLDPNDTLTGPSGFRRSSSDVIAAGLQSAIYHSWATEDYNRWTGGGGWYEIVEGSQSRSAQVRTEHYNEGLGLTRIVTYTYNL